MRKIGLLAGLLLLTPVAWADAPHTNGQPFFGTDQAQAVLNAPSVAVQVGKEATNVIQPGVETLYDFKHSDWRVGTSAALYTFSSKSFPIASLRAGYAPSEEVYGEIQLDLQGITQRYISPHVPSLATAGPLDGIWSILGKYGQVGAFAGYDFDQSSDGSNHAGGITLGAVIGGKLTF